MDEKKRYLCIVGGLIVICLVAWLICSGTRGSGNGTGHYNNIQDGLERIDTEQQRAKDSVDRVTEGIVRAEESASRIGASIERSEDIARNIADDLRRNDELVRDATERIERAEERKREIAEGIDRCERRLADGLRSNSASESIFSRYEKRD